MCTFAEFSPGWSAKHERYTPGFALRSVGHHPGFIYIHGGEIRTIAANFQAYKTAFADKPQQDGNLLFHHVLNNSTDGKCLSIQVECRDKRNFGYICHKKQVPHKSTPGAMFTKVAKVPFLPNEDITAILNFVKLMESTFYHEQRISLTKEKNSPHALKPFAEKGGSSSSYEEKGKKISDLCQSIEIDFENENEQIQTPENNSLNEQKNYHRASTKVVPMGQGSNVISSSFQFLEDYPEAVLDSKMMEGLSAKANALIDRSFQSLDE